MDGPYFCLRTCRCKFVASACSPDAATAAFRDHIAATLTDERMHELSAASSGPSRSVVAAPVPVPEPSTEE